ncbi:MAG: site-specific DNA-methyltransferase [Sphingorhabdus sp.]|uniref:site-specific DNA-methyltransferase n=1 Tax=Sphingorhabdus sp. TaxID=1902408 RepID=UPI0038FCD168
MSEIRQIEWVEVSKLKPSPRNARTHSLKQIEQVARSIDEFGFNNPIIIDGDNMVVAGHCRLAAAKSRGLIKVPVIALRNLSKAQVKAFALADNKIALNAGWDYEILAEEFGEMFECNYDTTLTGFDAVEIDMILTDVSDASVQPTMPEDEYPSIPESGDVIVQPGDIWSLGRHRIMCGDAKSIAEVAKLMGTDTATMVFVDPPYNVPIDGHVCGLGRVRHREFAEASGEMTSGQFVEFLTSSFVAIASVCKDGAIIYACMDWRHLAEIIAAGESVFTEQKNLCVWSKTNAGMGTFYRSQHELITVWKKGHAPHINNFGLGDKGRYRTNVWSYAGVNTFKRERREELAAHPTVKPVNLVADAIRDVSNRGDTVLDTFGGSGTTLIAAEKTGRIARLMELDPAYCQITICPSSDNLRHMPA